MKAGVFSSGPPSEHLVLMTNRYVVLWLSISSKRLHDHFLSLTYSNNAWLRLAGYQTTRWMWHWILDEIPPWSPCGKYFDILLVSTEDVLTIGRKRHTECSLQLVHVVVTPVWTSQVAGERVPKVDRALVPARQPAVQENRERQRSELQVWRLQVRGKHTSRYLCTPLFQVLRYRPYGWFIWKRKHKHCLWVEVRVIIKKV